MGKLAGIPGSMWKIGAAKANVALLEKGDAPSRVSDGLTLLSPDLFQAPPVRFTRIALCR